MLKHKRDTLSKPQRFLAQGRLSDRPAQPHLPCKEGVAETRLTEGSSAHRSTSPRDGEASPLSSSTKAARRNKLSDFAPSTVFRRQKIVSLFRREPLSWLEALGRSSAERIHGAEITIISLH
jgi:hypothetical protein